MSVYEVHRLNVEPSGLDASKAEVIRPSNGFLLMKTFTHWILCQAQVYYPLKSDTSLWLDFNQHKWLYILIGLVRFILHALWLQNLYIVKDKFTVTRSVVFMRLDRNVLLWEVILIVHNCDPSGSWLGLEIH